MEDYEPILRRATSGSMPSRDQQRLIKLTVSSAKKQTFYAQITFSILVIALWVTLGNLLPAGGYSDLIMQFSGFVLVLGGWILLLRRRSKIACRLYSGSLLRKGIRPKFCLTCFYDLQGSVAQACPECGEPLAPLADSETGIRLCLKTCVSADS